MLALYTRFIFAVLVVFCGSFSTLTAQSFDSFQAFQEFIKDTVYQSIPVEPGDELEVSLVHVSPNMNLPECPSPLNATLAQPGVSAPSNTVVVKCAESSNAAPLYIPVQIKLMTDTLTAARRIMPGEVISAQDVLIQKNDKYQIYDDYFQDKNALYGLIASRLIPAGGVILKKSIGKTLYVKKNQAVTLVVRHGAIEIGMAGIAKMDGYLNDTIKVVNPSSQKVVDAQVIGPGKVSADY